MSAAESSSMNKYICIHCATPTPTLYEQYPSFIKMTQCKNCKETVDKYAEYDAVLVIVDLVLQYQTAYRHVMYNRTVYNLPRIFTIFVFCGAYDRWIRSRIGHEGLYDLEWKFYRSLLESCLEVLLLVFLYILLELYVNRSFKRTRFVTQAAVAGFYGNICVVLSIIFSLHEHFSYFALTTLFSFLTKVQLLRAVHLQFSYFTSSVMTALFTLITSGAAYLLHELWKS